MKPAIIKKLDVKMLFIVVLLFAAAYTTLYAPLVFEMPQVSSSSSSGSKEKPAANTGSVFSGQVLRTFTGAKRLQHEAVVSKPQFSIPLHPRSKLCEKWGVVTTINAPRVRVRVRVRG
jgi:hypothetical protein